MVVTDKIIGIIMTLLNKLTDKIFRRKYLPFILMVTAILAVLTSLFYLLEVPSVLAQSAADSLPTVAMPQSGQKILVFSPHPDDETIGVGGYIARSIAVGADVRIVLVTDGDYHNNGPVRYAEFKKATQILGVPDSNLVFLGLPDSKLDKMDKTSLAAALKSQIDQYNPDFVICPFIKDGNPDHSMIGKAVESILKVDPNKRIVYEYLVHYRLIWPRPRGFEPDIHLSPPQNLVTPDVRWETFPLSLAEENVKSEAIRTYQSQNGNLYLKGLLLSSIRRNELLVVPLNMYTQ
jgi:N-acetylglucosamine malate deacetylase 1